MEFVSQDIETHSDLAMTQTTLSEGGTRGNPTAGPVLTAGPSCPAASPPACAASRLHAIKSYAGRLRVESRSHHESSYDVHIIPVPQTVDCPASRCTRLGRHEANEFFPHTTPAADLVPLSCRKLRPRERSTTRFAEPLPSAVSESGVFGL